MADLTVHTAAAVELDDLNSFVVALYENEGGFGLEVQRSLTVDEQDVALGLDSYCVSISAGPSHYGGIQSCVLRGRSLELGFSTDAAEALGLDPRLVLDLRVDDARLEEIRHGLKRVLAGADAPSTLVLEGPTDG